MSALRRLTRVLLVAVLGIGALVVLALGLIQTSWVKNYLRQIAERRVESATGAELSIGALGGNLLSGAELRHVRFAQDGHSIAEVPEIDVDYSLPDLLTGSVDVGSVVLHDPVIHLRRTAQGTLNLAALGPARRGIAPSDRRAETKAAPSSGRGWSIGELVIDDGTLTIADDVVRNDTVNAPERLVDLDADIGIGSRREGGIRLGIDSMSFETVSPSLTVESAKGEFVVAPDQLRFGELTLDTSAGSISLDGTIRQRTSTPAYDLQVATRDLELPELGAFVPALRTYAIAPTIDARLEGPLTELHADFSTQSAAGRISGEVIVDATAPGRGVRGTIQTRNLNLASLNLGERTDLTLTAKVDLQTRTGDSPKLTGTYEVTAPEFHYGAYDAQNLHASGRIHGEQIRVTANAEAYGGTVRTEGTITLPSGKRPVQYDLKGHLRDVDPSSLPDAIGLPPAVTAAAGDGLVADGGPDGIDLDFRIAGRGSQVGGEARLRDFSFAGAEFSNGTVVDVWREGGRLHYSAEGSVTDLSLLRLGRALGIDALKAPRFASDINASFDISGSGTDLETLTLGGMITLTESELFGARVPSLLVNPDLTRGSGSIALDGRFNALDVDALTPRPSLRSALSGTIDASIRLGSLADPDSSLQTLDAGGRLTFADSRISNVSIEKGVVDASISGGVARVKELTITGPDLTVDASGTLAVDKAGESDVRFVIDTPALQRFDALGVPASGDVLLRGQIGGNLARLTIEGTLSGTQVGFGATEALAIHSDYDIVIPNLAPSRARVTAVTELSQLQAAERSFATVKTRTEYIDHVLEFAATVQDAGRTVDADGRVLWHPDHQELHLRRFDFRTADATWNLTGGDAAIRYGGDRLAIQNLTLISGGGGRIAVDGSLGSADSLLKVAIDDLRLDDVDDLILPAEPLSGLIDATAAMRGTFSQPIVDAHVAITQGGYRGFEYESAGGTIQYQPGLVRLDVRVQQSEAAALTASGVVPLSTDAGEELRVTVRSTPIDLALAQTFTNELQNVSGTAQVDVAVGGSLSAPVLDGSLQVRHGAFTVVLAQSHYSGLETDITFDRDLVTVREFHLFDDEGNRLRIGGQLALNRRAADRVNIDIHSDNFEMADNRLAELNVDTDLRITGELLRPRIEGTIGLREALLRIDRVLQLTDDPYQVNTTPAEPSTEQPSTEQPSTSRDVFAPSIDVNLAIRDSLVVRGTDLRAPGGTPVGLGDVNVTIGGDVQIRKTPGADPILVGELQTIRGTYQFHGREFTIQRGGAIVFRGTSALNPRLDIRAQREISGVVASVHIDGALDAPELELSSQPPMEDAEILSLIVFNQPLSLLGTGAQISLAARATAIATGFVASQLTRSINDVLELDVLEIETTTSAGTLVPVLTLGEQFGPLFVKLRQRFGPEAVSQAVIEYRIAEWLRLETSYAQGEAATRDLLRRIEAGGLDLIFFFSFR